MRRAFLLLFVLVATLTSAAQSPIVDHEVYLLQFVGGGQPLTPAERAEVATMVAAQMSAHPEQWRAIDQKEQTTIAVIEAASPVQRAALWDSNRYIYAFPQDPNSEYARNFGAVFAEEQKIIEAHDPVLGIDPQRHLVFTEHMIPAIHRAAAWAGGFYHVPGPDANFDARVRQAVQGLPSAQPDVAFGLTHIVALEPLIRPEVAKKPALAEQVSKASYQMNFAGKTNPTAEQNQLLGTTSAAAVRWGLHHGGTSPQGGGSMGQMLYMHQLALKGLHDAAMAGNPHCNPVLNSGSTLASFGCIAPVPVPMLP